MTIIGLGLLVCLGVPWPRPWPRAVDSQFSVDTCSAQQCDCFVHCAHIPAQTQQCESRSLKSDKHTVLFFAAVVKIVSAAGVAPAMHAFRHSVHSCTDTVTLTHDSLNARVLVGRISH